VLSKLWAPFFFRFKRPVVALAILMSIAVTATAIGVLMVKSNVAVAFYLWIPYLLWLLVSLVFNGAFLVAYAQPSDEQALSNVQRMMHSTTDADPTPSIHDDRESSRLLQPSIRVRKR